MQPLVKILIYYFNLQPRPLPVEQIYIEAIAFAKSSNVQLPDDFDKEMLNHTLQVMVDNQIIHKYKTLWGPTTDQFNILHNWVYIDQIIRGMPG